MLEGIDLVQRKAHNRLRFGGFSDAETYGCIVIFGLLVSIVLGLGSGARNRLPPDTPNWERQLVFWVVGLSPIVGGIMAGMISGALHIRRGTFRRGNRVQILSSVHEGCMGVVRGTRTEVEKIHLVGEHYMTNEIIHISVEFEQGDSVVTEEFKEDDLVKVGFRSRWF